MSEISDVILETMSKTFSIEIEDLKEKTNKRPYPYLRSIYYFLMIKNTTLTLNTIGEKMYRTRPSVSLSLKSFDLHIKTNDEFLDIFNQINNNLPNNLKIYKL